MQKAGKLKYRYNLLGIQHFFVESQGAIPAGQHQVRMEFAYAGGGLGKGGTASLYIDGKKVGAGKIAATAAIIFSADDGCDVGDDTGAPVSPDYGARGNAFNGRVRGVQIALAEAAEAPTHMVSPEEAVARSDGAAIATLATGADGRTGGHYPEDSRLRSVVAIERPLAVECSWQTAADIPISLIHPNTCVAMFGQPGASQRYSVSASSRPSGAKTPVLIVTRGIEPPLRMNIFKCRSNWLLSISARKCAFWRPWARGMEHLADGIVRGVPLQLESGNRQTRNRSEAHVS